MKLSGKRISLLTILGMSVLALQAGGLARTGEEAAEKSGTISAGLWQQKGSETFLLTTLKQPTPITTALKANTQIEGVCVHCQIELSCRASELAKKCPVCPCGFSNLQCLAGKASPDKTSYALLESLPLGTRLRVEYVNADRPGEGLKRLSVDRHGALLPVEGLAGAAPEQIQALGKAVGAVKTELSEDGSRLQFTLKDNWTTDKEQRLEKALAKSGAKVAAPEPAPTAP